MIIEIDDRSLEILNPDIRIEIYGNFMSMQFNEGGAGYLHKMQGLCKLLTGKQCNELDESTSPLGVHFQRVKRDDEIIHSDSIITGDFIIYSGTISTKTGTIHLSIEPDAKFKLSL